MIHRFGLTRTFEVSIDSVPGDEKTLNEAKELWETDKDKHRDYTINVALSAGDREFLKQILDGSMKKSVFLSQSLSGTSFNPCQYIDREIGNRIAVVAARYGHLDVIEDMLSKGADNKHTVQACAARYDHSTIVHKIGRGIMKHDNAVFNAAIGKHYKLLESLIKGRYVPYKAATHTACILAEDSALRELNMIIDRGADNFNELLSIAIEHGNREVIKLLIDKGADPMLLPPYEFKDILEEFCGKGYKEVDNDLIFTAASDGDLNKVEEICDNGFKDYLSVAVVATGSGNINIVKAMVRRFSKDCKGDPERMKEISDSIVEIAEDVEDINLANYAKSLL